MRKQIDTIFWAIESPSAQLPSGTNNAILGSALTLICPLCCQALGSSCYYDRGWSERSSHSRLLRVVPRRCPSLVARPSEFWTQMFRGRSSCDPGCLTLHTWPPARRPPVGGWGPDPVLRNLESGTLPPASHRSPTYKDPVTHSPYPATPLHSTV